MSLEHLDKLHVEDEGCERWNHGTCTALAISEHVRDVEAILGALCHELNTLCPTCNDLLQTKVGRLVALVAAVEHGAVEQTTLVVATHGVCSLWFLACTFVQHLILETALSHVDAVLIGILCQELLTLSLSSLSSLSLSCILFLFQLTEEVVYNLLTLLVAYLQVVVRD